MLALFIHQWFSDWPEETNTTCMCNNFQMKCVNVRLSLIQSHDVESQLWLPLCCLCIVFAFLCPWNVKSQQPLASAGTLPAFIFHCWTQNHIQTTEPSLNLTWIFKTTPRFMWDTPVSTPGLISFVKALIDKWSLLSCHHVNEVQYLVTW